LHIKKFLLSLSSQKIARYNQLIDGSAHIRTDVDSSPVLATSSLTYEKRVLMLFKDKSSDRDKVVKTA